MRAGWVNDAYNMTHLRVDFVVPGFVAKSENPLQDFHICAWLRLAPWGWMPACTHYTVPFFPRSILLLFEPTSSADPNGFHAGHDVIFADHAAGLHSAGELLFE